MILAICCSHTRTFSSWKLIKELTTGIAYSRLNSTKRSFMQRSTIFWSVLVPLRHTAWLSQDNPCRSQPSPSDYCAPAKSRVYFCCLEKIILIIAEVPVLLLVGEPSCQVCVHFIEKISEGIITTLHFKDINQK